MLPEDGDRIVFRLTEEQKKDIRDAVEKALPLEGIGNYPIPANRPMLVHRGYWKQEKERENAESGNQHRSEASASSSQQQQQQERQGGEAEGFHFFGAQIPNFGPPTPPPLPPPPPPLSARAGPIGVQRWRRSSPLSSAPTPAAAAAAGSGGAAAQASNPSQALSLATAGVDTSALNRQQAAEFFNSRVGRDTNGNAWRSVGHQRRPIQPNAVRQPSMEASMPPVLRRIRNRSNRGRRNGQQQPYQSHMMPPPMPPPPPPPPPPALQRQATSHNLFQRRRSATVQNVNNSTAILSSNAAPASNATNNEDELDDGRPIFGTANSDGTEYNFFFSSTVPLTSVFDEADDEATSSTSVHGRRIRRRQPIEDEPATPPTAGTQNPLLPGRRHPRSSLLDWATSVISTAATAPRNASGFFGNASTTAAPFSGYGRPRTSEPQAPTAGVFTSRVPAMRGRRPLDGTGSPIFPRDEDSSAAEYLGMNSPSPPPRLSRRSSPLFEPISRGSRDHTERDRR